MKKRAFSLVEMLVATVILAFVTVGTFAGFIAAKRYGGLASHRAQALNIARQTLEGLRFNVTAEDWSTGVGGTNDLDRGDYPLSDFTGSDGIVFTRSYNVTFVDIDGDGAININEPRKVYMNITWDER